MPSALNKAEGADSGTGASGNADEFLVVDCLLPARVKRLGSQLTYLSARQATRTSAGDCEIRGGEYVAYDRSNYQTALKVWLEPAKAGDPKAETYVGEIYERGVGGAPDYAIAAEWYRRAAEQGYAPAQINLGQLYEQGRGVAKDQLTAINWYRRASGFDEAGLSFVVSSDVAGELSGLRHEAMVHESDARRLREQIRSLDSQISQLEDQRRVAAGRQPPPSSVAPPSSAGPPSSAALEQIERQRTDLVAEQRRLDQERRQLEAEAKQLEQQRTEARNDASALAEVEQLKSDLDQRRQDLERRNQELAAREQSLAQRETELATALGQIERQRTGLAAEQRRLDQERRQLEAEAEQLEQQRTEARDDAAALAKVEQLKSDLGQRRLDLERRNRELAAREQSLAQRETELAAREAELTGREQQFAARSQEVTELDQRLAQLKQAYEDQRQQLTTLTENGKIALAGPVITMIDPELPAAGTRGLPVVRTSGGLESRQVVGRVEAPAGLFSLLINEQPQQYDDNNIFKSDVPITTDGTEVSIVAIDRQGKRADLGFILAPDTRTITSKQTSPQSTAPRPIPAVDFGHYHALVIGNNHYARLPKLDTAVADAELVAEVLTKKYGFQVKLLRDATRYAILSAMNELRNQLTEDDNLLIYYAGHGELDRANMRGNWLPIDAEPDSNANWISNVAVTDILNAMTAKHILVVADSCYSGALTRTALAQLDPGLSQEARVAWLRAMAKKRSRTALTSGGLAPTLDGGGGGHSVFARALVETLEHNDQVLEGQRLFEEVSALVTYAAEQMKFEQVPQYAPIKFAGHEAGDFFFVPKVGQLASAAD